MIRSDVWRTSPKSQYSQFQRWLGTSTSAPRPTTTLSKYAVNAAEAPARLRTTKPTRVTSASTAEAVVVVNADRGTDHTLLRVARAHTPRVIYAPSLSVGRSLRRIPSRLCAVAPPLAVRLHHHRPRLISGESGPGSGGGPHHPSPVPPFSTLPAVPPVPKPSSRPPWFRTGPSPCPCASVSAVPRPRQAHRGGGSPVPMDSVAWTMARPVRITADRELRHRCPVTRAVENTVFKLRSVALLGNG